MEDVSDGITLKDRFIQSLDRCSTNERFIPAFYQSFLMSSEDVRHKFRLTSFERQNKMLLRSLQH